MFLVNVVCFVFFSFQSTLIIFCVTFVFYCQVPSSHQVESQKTDTVTRGGVQSLRRVNGVSESAFLVEVSHERYVKF